MKKSTTMKVVAAAVAIALLVVAGCSDKKGSSRTPGLANQAVDTMSAKLADNVIDARHAVAPRQGSVASETAVPAADVNHVKDMIIVGSKIYAVHNRGVIVYDMADKSTKILSIGETINALAYYGGKVYAGGTRLYTIEPETFQPVELAFDGTISALGSSDLTLMIGTDRGLYSQSLTGSDQLMDDVFVTSLVTDGSGMWIGTAGQGLYRWDGTEVKKRYLARDPSLFDQVNCLSFNHDHLYVGTDSGMFVFNGGQWLTLTTDDDLPSNEIHSIDASNWVVYVATAEGVVSYFDGCFSPIAKLSDKNVTVIRTLGNKIIAGTESLGILEKSGPAIRTLIDPNNTVDSTAASEFSFSF